MVEECQTCVQGDGGEAETEEKVKSCYMLPRSIAEKVRELSSKIGVDQSEIVRLALTSPKKLSVLERAAKELEKIEREEK